MQDAMTEWNDKIDTNKKNSKSFVEFRKYCIKINLAKVGAKKALKSIGITNLIEEVDNQRISKLEQGFDKLLQGLSSLNSKVNVVVAALQQLENKPNTLNDQNDLITKLLTNNSQYLAAPSSKVSELEQKLGNVTNKLNNNNNNTNNKEIPDRYVLMKWIHYCSSCGVNPTHANDNCPHKQSWHKSGWAETFKTSRCGGKQPIVRSNRETETETEGVGLQRIIIRFVKVLA